MSSGDASIPREGALAFLRNRRGLVTSVEPSGHPRTERVHLVNVEYTDGEGVREDRVVWEREPGARIFEPTALPEVSSRSPMRADEFDALVRSTRWTSLTPFVDPDEEGPLERLPLAAPFHGAIQVEDFQLVPLLKALRMPRVSLLLADDVGLGKTIEAGLVLSELLLRRRIRRVLIMCPASLTSQWQQEMREKFALNFDLVDRASTHQLRKQLGMDANPWRTFPRIITSYYYLKQADILEQFLAASKPTKDSPHLPWDLLIVDEVHNLKPAAFGDDSDLSKMLTQVAPCFEHKMFLSATPHDGHTRSFSGILERLDPVRFSQTSELSAAERSRIEDVLVRRLKREINDLTDPPRFGERDLDALPLTLKPRERALSEAYQKFRKRVHEVIAQMRRSEQIAGSFAVEILGKRLLSCPVAFGASWHRYMDGLAEAEAAETSDVRAAERQVREDTGDDQEAESRVAHAAQTVGAWLKPLKGQLEDEIAAIGTALAGLGLGKPKGEKSVTDCDPKADSRFEALQAWIEKHLRLRQGKWRETERLVVFTEYKTTLDYLERRLRALYPKENEARIRVLFGNMSFAERDEIKAAFNDPDDPVRILLATDAASEGLNLQETARYLLHFDIPWNPSRLEQRNGRLDRHSQARDVVVYHFATDDDADMAFLSHVLKKVHQIREDLGSMEEVFDAAIERCLIKGEDHLFVIQNLDAQVEGAAGRVDLARDKTVRTYQMGEDEDKRLQALRAELDLDPDTLCRTLEVAMGVGVGLPRFDGPDEKGRFSLVQPIPPAWRAMIDDSLRLTGRKQEAALPSLVFDAEKYIHDINGRPVFRPIKGTALMHLNHPLYHRVLSTFARLRFPGVEGEATRWTVRRDQVPKGADALVLLTVEELAVNELREMFHHWVRTVAIPVKKGSLGKPLKHAPAVNYRSDALTAVDDQDRARGVWDDVEADVKDLVKAMRSQLTKRLGDVLDEEKAKALKNEQARFQSRQGEVSKLVERQTLRNLEKEIAEIRRERLESLPLDAGQYLRELAASEKEKEGELRRRRAHYDVLRQQLDQERERIIHYLIPRRHAMRGEAQVYPVAVEIRLPEGGR